MNIKHLRIFKEVCDKKSASKAAKSLYLAQPAVSLAIKELEQYYEVKLFDRISRKMILTQKGAELLNYTNAILAMFDEADEKMRQDSYQGKIVLGTSVTFANYFLFDVINNIKLEYPSIIVEIIVDSSLNIEDLVLNNKVDLGIVEGNIHNNNIEAKEIYQDELVFVSDINTNTIVTINDLNNRNFLLRNKGSAHREIFDGIVESNDLKINIFMESIDTNAIIISCIKGLGIALLPYKFVEKYLGKDLNIVQIKDMKSINRSYYLINHKKKYLSNSMKLFKDSIITRSF
jgi:DNA-binding transcriptional LysR family regulator